MTGYMSGNAGVNGWSIENIHGLIVNAKFLPAKIYVTIVPERDFYRGMSRLGGSPFWCHKPGFGLLELAYYYLSHINNRRYVAWDRNASKDDAVMVMELAVQKLKKMDNFIKSKGYIHMVYISPYRTEVTGTLTRDPAINRYLKRHAVPVTYIVDRIDRERMTLAQKQELFYDDVHLSKKGHILWGKIIGNDLKKLRL